MDSGTVPSETELAELISELPPAPAGWVRAAVELPRLRRELDRLAALCMADADVRAHTSPISSARCATRGSEPRPSRCASPGNGCSDQFHHHHRPQGRKAVTMSEQTPDKALNEEPEVEGHKKGLRPEEEVEELEAEVEGHLKMGSPEDPSRRG